MRPTALTAIVLTYVSGLLGIVATLRALIVAWYAIGDGFSFNPLRFCHSIFNLVSLGAVTVTLFTGAALLGRRNPRGRMLVIAASAAVIVLSFIELGVSAVSPDQGILAAHRWVWLALSIVTMIVALVAGNESPSTTGEPESPALRPTQAITLLVARAGHDLRTPFGVGGGAHAHRAGGHRGTGSSRRVLESPAARCSAAAQRPSLTHA